MRLFRNLTLKFLALLFAMVLWFHVATTHQYDVEIQYRLNYSNLPDRLVIAIPPVEEYGVLMRGPGKALLRLMWGERRWPIDLSRAKIGEQRIVLASDQVPLFGIQGLQVIALLGSDTLTVTIDSVGQKTVPIRSALQIEAGDGFVLSRAPRLIPESTVLIGPRVALAAIHEVWTEAAVLTNAAGPIERLLPIRRAPGFGISTSAAQAQVYQKIEPYLMRSFEAIPVRFAQTLAPDTLEIWPTHVQVEVAGPQSAIVNLVSDSIIVRCEPTFNSDGHALARAFVTVSPPLEVLKVSPDSVTLERHGGSRADTRD